MSENSNATEPLHPLAFHPLPLGSVRPSGWLLDQLRVQANGITGHIEEFWPDLGPTNMWLGGDSEGWERGPYYLEGLVPLAYLLSDERLIATAQKWIEAILARQREDGWIGPVQAPDRRPYDVWPVMIVLKVLTQYAEATGDDRAVRAVESYCQWLHAHLDEHPLFEWGHFRWADLVLSIDWLYGRTKETWLLELAGRVRDQGYDWTAHFTGFAYTEKTKLEDCTLRTHVVNNAMGVKTPGVWARHSGEAADREGVYRALENLDRYHGQATGLFTGDEHLAGREPTQGTELCAVVEYMFSLEHLISILGDPAFGDRLERIAYNALPAANTPDFWAHQYDQQANQTLCSVAPRDWTNNDDTSNVFGLEPNYGCCTANLHQGWPKLVAHLWMATPDGGLAAVAYGPSRVTSEVTGNRTVTIHEETEYPFRETVWFRIETPAPARFSLLLRIPAWADGATIHIGGKVIEPEAGSFHRVEREWTDGDILELHLPMALRAETREHGAVALHRGPLVFALKVGEEWTQIGGEVPHADWAISPTTAWNYGLALDSGVPEAALELVESPITETPFDTAHPPVTLRGLGRRLLAWTMERNSAGRVPEPTGEAGPEEAVELMPYGSTQLRITEFPVLGGE